MLYAAFCTAVLLAAILNRKDRKTLALCLVVSAGFFSPLPNDDWLMFYVAGVLTEFSVAFAAWRLNCAASQPIVVLSFLMAACHVAGALFDGYPALSQYRILIPIFEVSEPIFIVILSPYFSRLLFNHEPPTV